MTRPARRQARAVLLGVLLFVAFGLAATGATAQTAPPPFLTIDNMFPHCAAAGSAVRFSADGRTDRPDVNGSMRAPNGAVIASTTVKQIEGRWTVSLAFTPQVTGDYEFRATVSGATMSGYFSVPCRAPVLEYAPTCFVVGSTNSVTMTGRNFRPYDAGYMYYDVGGSEAQGQIRIPVDARGNFSATFKVNPSDRDHPGEATDANRQLVGRATWRACPPDATTTSTTTVVDETTTSTTRPLIGSTTTSTTIPTIVSIPPPTAGASLVLTPSVGPGGFVATARGAGFPAGQPVTLGWSPGLGLFQVTASATGEFTLPVLIMNRDIIGPRTLVATSGTTSASAAFLVVQSTVQPSGKDVAQISRIRRFLSR